MADSTQTKCNVPGCKSIKDAKEENSVNFFEIPKRVRCTPEIRMEWLKKLRLERSRFPSNFSICEKHFDERDILKPLEDSEHRSWVTLLPKAIPMHFLPDENTPKEEFVFEDRDDQDDSDDYPQSRESTEKEVIPKVVTMEEQQADFETFHDAVDETVQSKENEEQRDLNIDDDPEDEKVYHDLKPHIADEVKMPSEQSTKFAPNITKFAKELSSEEKVLKVVKRVAPARSAEPAKKEEESEESPAKRPRRNVIHKLIKPRNIQDVKETPVKTIPTKKTTPKPSVVIVKKIVKTPEKVEMKVAQKVEMTLVKPKIIGKVIKPAAKVIKVSPKVEKEKTPKLVVKAIQKTIPKELDTTDKIEATSSRSRRNVVHKLIKPRVEPAVTAATTINKMAPATIVAKPLLIAKSKAVDIYSSPRKPEEKVQKKDDNSPKSPKIVMISSKLIQGSPKFLKSPPPVVKISPRNVVATVKPSTIVMTPKQAVITKVAVKRLPTKVHPIDDDDSSRPRRNVPHKFIKTNNNGIEKEKKVSTPPTQKLDPVEAMHIALLKEFLSDSKSVQIEGVKKKAISIAKIIGLKSFKASDEWTKKFIAGNFGTCNGSN